MRNTIDSFRNKTIHQAQLAHLKGGCQICHHPGNTLICTSGGTGSNNSTETPGGK